MKVSLIHLSFFILLSLNVHAQDNWYPTPKEVQCLDSVVISRFKESLCYDSTESYKIWHIFKYEFTTDSLHKKDFLTGTILSKIQKSYMPKSYLTPHTVPYHQQSLALWASNQKNPVKCRDSLIRLGKLMDIDRFSNKNVDGIKIVEPECSYISDKNGHLVETWNPMDEWTGCREIAYLNKDVFNLEMFKILKKGDYRIVFQIYMTAGLNYFAIDNKGGLFLFTNGNGNISGVKKLTVEELVNGYWNNFDVLKLFDK